MAEGNKTYQVKANGFIFSFTDEEINAIDLHQVSPTGFNLIKDHQSINARLINANSTGKMQVIEIEAETFTVEIKDELDQELEKMGFGLAANKQIKEIKAPMPGLVLDIAVTDGQAVNEGDKILILGAMKMENSILIHSAARIKKVAVVSGQAVEKGQVLVELE
jgi:biotin carboxyl carrier protein